MNRRFLTFKEWKDAVDVIVYKKIKYNLDDLPDENYHVNYDNNITTIIMANIVIENNLNA